MQRPAVHARLRCRRAIDGALNARISFLLAPMRPVLWLLWLALCACQQVPPLTPGSHLSLPASLPGSDIPPPLPPSAPPARPVPSTQAAFSLNVSHAPVQDILVNLARDAKVNMDIHPAISGTVSLHAIRQPLPALLDRIAQQVDIRWLRQGDSYSVLPDLPYMATYTLDYVAIERDTHSEMGVLSAVAAGQEGRASNASTTRLTSRSQQRFWTTLVKNLEDLLRREDETLQVITVLREEEIRDTTTLTEQQTRSRKHTPAGPGTPAGVTERDSEQNRTSHTRIQPGQRFTSREDKIVRVTLHSETGVLAVRGTARQQALVSRFLRQVSASARRQVLIEATIVEVELTREFETGVDWSRLAQGRQLAFMQNTSGLLSADALRGNFPLERALGQSPVSLLFYQSGSIASAVKLLEHFGRTRVLSSPKLMALNNQAALLKVVRDIPYFSIKVRRTEGTNDKPDRVEYESTLHTVPEGIVMSVQPQISASGQVLLHVRPTITHILGFISDPAVTLVDPRVTSLVPRVQVREMESTLRLGSGQIGVLGGLIQDKLDQQSDGLPGLSMLDGLGRLFSRKTDQMVKTELVVFLRPTLIDQPDLSGDLRGLRPSLPDASFFTAPLPDAPAAASRTEVAP